MVWCIPVVESSSPWPAALAKFQKRGPKHQRIYLHSLAKQEFGYIWDGKSWFKEVEYR